LSEKETKKNVPVQRGEEEEESSILKRHVVFIPEITMEMIEIFSRILN
jgi:hypothetical protein